MKDYGDNGIIKYISSTVPGFSNEQIVAIRTAIDDIVAVQAQTAADAYRAMYNGIITAFSDLSSSFAKFAEIMKEFEKESNYERNSGKISFSGNAEKTRRFSDGRLRNDFDDMGRGFGKWNSRSNPFLQSKSSRNRRGRYRIKRGRGERNRQ